jgi:vacuolar-type H+-ATPase subunit E/Vma4
MTALRADRVMPALQPVRAELLRRASADADRMIDDARREAARIVEEATETARQVTEKARAAGEAAGAAVAAAEAASLRLALRRELLAAQDGAYRQWRERGCEAVLRLRDEPGYAAWRDALERTARATLGEGARVADDPGGGVIAEHGRRRLDLSLSAIAARAQEAIAPEIDGLWA